MNSERLYGAVDIGGTTLRVGIVDEHGHILARRATDDHINSGEDKVMELIAAQLNTAAGSVNRKPADLIRIGVGAAGHIRYPEGVYICSSNLRGKFSGYPVKASLEALLHTPVEVNNDANAQACGEWRFGAARGCRNAVFLTFSTGVGGGIIIDNKIFRGVTGTADEFGHTIIDSHSPIECSCGNKGCAMALAGTIGLPQRFELKRDEFDLQSKCCATRDEIKRLNGLVIEEGLAHPIHDRCLCAPETDKRCPIMTAVYRDTLTAAGIIIYNAFQTFNPDLIIVGGGLTQIHPDFYSELNGVFNRYARHMLYDPLTIVPPGLKNNAGLIGAAALAMDAGS